MPIAGVNGVSIHYELSGPESALCIAFANSVGSDLRMWNKIAPFFERDFRLLRFDTRGHGLSSAPAPPYTLDQLGSDLLGLLDFLSMGRVSVCGLALGGLVGQWLAIHAPSRLENLILANTSARFLTADVWDARIAFVESQGMAALASATLNRWFTPQYIEGHRKEMKEIAAMIEQTSPQGYIGCCHVLRNADMRESLGKIEARTLVIAGTYDPATPPADARVLHSGIRGAEYMELNASHLSAWERPVEFAKAIGEFLLR